MAQLQELGISFPDTATISQLRELLRDVVGASVPSPQASKSTALAETQTEAEETDTQQLERQLEAKLKILKLQKQIAELEEPKLKAAANFGDVEGVLPKFTGDDDYAVTKWVKEFERVTNIVGCTAAEKFLFARRMMAGSACLFMRNSNANNWDSFKQDLCNEFKKVIGTKDIFKRLENRVWNKNLEKLHSYVLTMQQIADDAPISEAELVECILEGLRDKTSAISIFYPAKTVAELKNLIPRYEKILDGRKINKTTSENQTTTSTTVRCYNCSEYGHYASSCTREKRQHGSCFKCGKFGHLRTQCPLRAVAAVPDQAVNWNLKVRVALGPQLSESNFCFINSLLDTGSPCSFVKTAVIQSLWPNVRIAEGRISEYKGLDGTNLKTCGRMPVYIEFAGQMKKVNLNILINSPCDLVLGRDFLDLFSIVLCFKNGKPDPNELIKNAGNNCCTLFSCSDLKNELNAEPTEIKYEMETNVCDAYSGLHEGKNKEIHDAFQTICNIEVQDEREDVDINHMVGLQMSDKIRTIIYRNYFQKLGANPESSDFKASILVNSGNTTYCAPRRLSFAEKQEVNKIISDLLEKGIIRHSNSPYASPIVLTKKKNGERRMCIDYRALNKIIVRDNYPIPLIEDCLEHLEGKSWFSIMDLKSGFYQVRLEENSVKYT